jgi:ferrous iron transport protein B
MNPTQASHLTIALVGNPNSGKTTLYNDLTGSSQMVGNWPGVTVERKEGFCELGKQRIRVVDLPGIYSLVAHSEDERVSRDYLLSGEASLVINVVDSTNLERNLYLTILLREAGIPVVVALNMWDLASKRGIVFDIPTLEGKLGAPCIPVSATHAKTVAKFKERLSQILVEAATPQVFADTEIPDLIHQASEALGGGWKGLAALESMEHPQAKYWSDQIETELGEVPQVLLAEARYRFIGKVLSQTTRTPGHESILSKRLDQLLLHRIWGLPLFFLAMYLVFWTTIHLGGAFIDFFDISVGALLVDGTRQALTAMGFPDIAIVVVADGIGGGIQTLSTFIPIIFVLFLLLSTLEDSGYMSRAAFLMDRFMRILGLPGKAFVPLLVGFGCTVPAIMATRTLEHKRDRIMTILMAPFMSCGAKMPVYALFAVAFFPGGGQNAVFLLYIAGIIVAIGTGLLLKKSLLQGEPARFVMELPPYHIPHPQGIVRHAWFRLKDFISKAGKVLIVVMAILGTLNAIDSEGNIGVAPGKHSLLATAGLAVAPVFAPMGVEKENWPASVALFMGVFAKEIVVGTLNALYLQQAGLEQVGQIATTKPSLVESMKTAVTTTAQNLKELFITTSANSSESNPVLGLLRKNFSKGPLQAFAFLLFVLLYVPCVSAVSTAARELGTRMTFFMVLYTTGLAWTLSTLFYQVTLGHDLVWISISLAIMGIGLGSLLALGRSPK